MRHINGLLQKNRRILAAILPNSANRTKTSQAQLLEKGFLFQYSTHQVANKKGHPYHFCYEYGYLSLGESNYLVVRIKNQETSY
jgi:hypothetical protein